jgi:hypothetical protein
MAFMDINHLVETLRQDLARAAEVGGDDTRAAAERLLSALDPALRLTLMDALSQAAAEIGEALPGVAIDVRLKGREPVFVVEGAPRAASEREPFETDDDEAVMRITLRLPEALKTRAEALAAGRGQSLNTWLVAAARAAASDSFQQTDWGRRDSGGRHIKGWAR